MFIALSGSLRRESYNTKLLEEVGEYLGDVKIFDISHFPLFNEDAESDAHIIDQFRAAVLASNGVVISTPEYNGSVPGPLKNALDWLSRPFPGNALQGKPVVVLGATTGLFGAVWAQADLRRIVGVIGGTVLGEDDIPIGQVDTRSPIIGDDEIGQTICERLDQLRSTMLPIQS